MAIEAELAALAEIDADYAGELQRVELSTGPTPVRQHRAKRRYGSVDDLVSKRVLTRSTFSQIKDRISCLRPPEGGS